MANENSLQNNAWNTTDFSGGQCEQTKSVIVTAIEDFRIIVKTDDGRKGTIQMRNMSKQFVPSPSCLYYIGQHLTVKVLGIDDKGSYVLGTKQLQDFSIYKRGENVNVRITEITKDGLQFVTDDNNLAQGFIHNNQIDWQQEKAEWIKKRLLNTGTDSQLRKMPTKITCEIHSNSEKEEYSSLYCSLKEMRQNPWNGLFPGMCMIGSIVGGNIGNFTIELENGLLAKCSDVNNLKINTGLQFVILSIDKDKISGSIIVSHDLLCESQSLEQAVCKYFTSSTTNTTPSLHQYLPNRRQLILPNRGMYKYLLLLPQLILYKCKPMAMPFALHFLQYFIDNPQTIRNYNVKRLFNYGKCALISIDIVDYPNIYHGLTINYTSGTKLNGKLLCNTPHYAVTTLPGMIGFVDSNLSSEKNEVKACIIDTCDNQLHLYHLGVCNDICATTLQDKTANTNQLLTPEEKEEANSEELNSIEKLLGYAPWLGELSIKLCNTDIYAIDANHHTQLKFMSKNKRDSLRHGKFHIANMADKTGGMFFLIYNEEDFVLNLRAIDGKIMIIKFFSERNSQDAQWLLNKYKRIRPLVLPGNKLHLVSRYDVPQGYDAQAAVETIVLQQEVATHILPGIKKRLKERKKSYGEDYATMAEFLDYQQKKEESVLSGIKVTVPPRCARHGSNSETDSMKASLMIDRDLCESFMAEIKEDEAGLPVYASIGENERPIACRLEDSPYEDSCVLSFDNQHFNLDDFILRGFTIIYRPNVRHLRLQRNGIDQFVKNDELLSKLKEKKLCPPRVDMAQPFSFKDKKFLSVEPGNNQPAAIRKALACNDIFLIQGPPGTGKTSVIVEIVRQLVERGERVLVCSQAHSAVRNVYERLLCTELSKHLGFLDEQDTMRGMSAQDHEQFLKNNLLLLDRLSKQRGNQTETITYGSDYAAADRDDFMRQHTHIAQYHTQALSGHYTEAKSIVDDFRHELQEQADSSLFYATGHLRSLKVVMGTCIGIGMYNSIQRSGISFDTVIIDEAGKANYGETIVPMRLGKRHILVGDQRQLPPYIDREEVKDFLAQKAPTDNLTARSKEKEVEEALSSSLFEDFLKNSPPESKILLNYQYRMHPDIGNFISKLFYGGELQNGKGTQEQTCAIEGYPNPVTFRDTQNEKDHYERSRNGHNLYNQCEINIVCEEIAPAIENTLTTDGSLTVGIVTPYREQAYRLRQRLGQSIITKGCNSGVFTIDSIQGREFDIVVLSFVRSFPRESGKNVGFLDDMRRLNVALSRARKKLILVGDLDTLLRRNAHRTFFSSDKTLQPVEVFHRISENCKKHGAFDMIAKLRLLEKDGKIKEGDILSECEIATFIQQGKSERFSFKTMIDGESLQFPIINTYDAQYAIRNSQARSVMFAGYDKDRPVWWPFMEAKIEDFDGQTITLELCDGTRTKLKRPNNHFMNTLLNDYTCELENVWLPFCAGYGDKAFLHNDILRKINAGLKEGGHVLCQVVGEDENWYTVYNNGSLGKIMKNAFIQLSIGSTYRCRVYKIYENEGKTPMIIYKMEKTFRPWT